MPEAGRALHLLNKLQSVSLQFGGEVKVRACDGTAGNVNTWPGTSGGVCRLFELVIEPVSHQCTGSLSASYTAMS